MIRLLALAALLVAGTAHAGFAPPLDRPVLKTRVQTRTIGGRRLTFATSHRIVFRAAGNGYAADVTLLAATGEGPAAAAFERGLAGLRGRTVRYWLAADGTLVSVEDLDAVWAAWTAGLPAAPVASPERRLAILGSTLTETIGDPPPAGTRPVRVPVSTLGGEGDPLAGFEAVVPAGRGRLRATTSAQGPVRLPAAAGGAQALASVRRSRLFDTAAGLVVEDRETGTIAAGTARIVTENTTTITVPVS